MAMRRRNNRRKILFCVLVSAVILLLLVGCGNGRQTPMESSGSSEPAVETPSASEPVSVDASSEGDAHSASEGEQTAMKMQVEVNGKTFTATMENNAAVDALVDKMKAGPITIQMSDYAGFEKVGALGQNLPTSDRQTTTRAGDIVLYQGNQIVIFYGSNAWSYTRLGKIDDLTGWAEALGSGDVSVTFSLAAAQS